MPTDTIPHSALHLVRTVAAPRRLRVLRDGEGWPIIPGRQGTIEFHCDGVDCHGCPEPGPLLAVWSEHPRLFPKLWAIPGVRRWQTGDQEMRALFPARWPGSSRRATAGGLRRRPISPVSVPPHAMAATSRP